ncbi:MAG: hypothetical protein OEY31_02975 [Candidatus Bathyarchaeota archaeon]|nr:hypothetical protein [Candidatus Bathyarchaeota archaeon]
MEVGIRDVSDLEKIKRVDSTTASKIRSTGLATIESLAVTAQLDGEPSENRASLHQLGIRLFWASFHS